MKRRVVSVVALLMLVGCSGSSPNGPAYLPTYTSIGANQNAPIGPRTSAPPSAPDTSAGWANLMGADVPTQEQCDAVKVQCEPNGDEDSSADSTSVSVDICVRCELRLTDIGPGSVIPTAWTDLRGVPLQRFGTHYGIPFPAAPGVVGPMGTQFMSPLTAFNNILVGGGPSGAYGQGVHSLPFTSPYLQGLNQQVLGQACGGQITPACIQRVDMEAFVGGSALCSCMDDGLAGRLTASGHRRCTDIADELSLGEEWSTFGKEMKELGMGLLYAPLGAAKGLAGWAASTALGQVRNWPTSNRLFGVQRLFSNARTRGLSCGGSTVEISGCVCVNAEIVCD